MLFEVLMRRHNQKLYRAARAILRDDHEAEDVMQEAYVNAYSHLAQFDGRAKFSTWLTKIAVHEAFARARRRSRYQQLDDESLETHMPTIPSPDPERQAYVRELGALIESAVDGLGDGYREVFMHMAEGARTLCPDYISSQMSLSSDTRSLLGQGDSKSSTPLAPPLDYAARAEPGKKGGLDEDYGFDSDANTQH